MFCCRGTVSKHFGKISSSPAFHVKVRAVVLSGGGRILCQVQGSEKPTQSFLLPRSPPQGGRRLGNRKTSRHLTRLHLKISCCGIWTLLADRHQGRLHRACLSGEQTGKLRSSTDARSVAISEKCRYLVVFSFRGGGCFGFGWSLQFIRHSHNDFTSSHSDRLLIHSVVDAVG